MPRLRAAVLFLAATCTTASLTAQAPASTRGTLFIVGGGPQPAALVQEFVDLAAGRGKARIVIFAMASASGQRSGEEKAVSLRALGAEAQNVWIARDQAMTDSATRLLDGATGIWFGGGDQNRLADVLRGTPVERAIHGRYAAGAVVGGTSAGAAVMSAVMITGSERNSGGTRPDTTLDWVTIARDNTLTTNGFSLIDNAVIDQHFLRRKRHNRLISLVLERAPHLGAGIDESTALVVHPNGTWSVRGASVVVIYDARQAAVTPVGEVLGASGLRMHVLPAGATFDPRSGQAALAAPAR
jgi:cyanophycinase